MQSYRHAIIIIYIVASYIVFLSAKKMNLQITFALVEKVGLCRRLEGAGKMRVDFVPDVVIEFDDVVTLFGRSCSRLLSTHSY